MPILLGLLDRVNLCHWITRFALSKEPNRIVVSLPLPEDVIRSTFRNLLFIYLESRTMDKVHKPSNSKELNVKSIKMSAYNISSRNNLAEGLTLSNGTHQMLYSLQSSNYM
jgi:hypothetical protein